MDAIAPQQEAEERTKPPITRGVLYTKATYVMTGHDTSTIPPWVLLT